MARTYHQVRYSWKERGITHHGRTVVLAATSQDAARILQRQNPHISVTTV